MGEALLTPGQHVTTLLALTRWKTCSLLARMSNEVLGCSWSSCLDWRGSPVPKPSGCHASAYHWAQYVLAVIQKGGTCEVPWAICVFLFSWNHQIIRWLYCACCTPRGHPIPATSQANPHKHILYRSFPPTNWGIIPVHIHCSKLKIAKFSNSHDTWVPGSSVLESSPGDVSVACGAHGSPGCAGTTAPGFRDGVADAGTEGIARGGNMVGDLPIIPIHFWIGLMYI